MIQVEPSIAFAKVCELESGLAWKQEGEPRREKPLTNLCLCLRGLPHRIAPPHCQAWCCAHASRGCLYDCEAALGRRVRAFSYCPPAFVSFRALAT